MEKSIPWRRLALVCVLGLGLASCRRNSRSGDQKGSTASRPHGELISAGPVPPSAPLVETSTNEQQRKKHPKPPSVQRRMVLAELIQSGQSNSGNASLASGTAGTAADLAKTNLPLITSLTVPGLHIAGYSNVTFSVLSDFDFGLTQDIASTSSISEATAALATAQIPPSVRSLDGRKVVIEGFLLPVKMNNGLAVEFLLMRNQSMCCYGVAPKINEWITVQTSGEGVKPVMDQPIAVAGVLHVGPIMENGSLAGIYRLEADKISAPF